MQMSIEALVASWARPIRLPVEGAPRQPAEVVRVVGASDSTLDPGCVGRVGTVEYLEYSCGCGQTFPGDPMIGVRFADGTLEEFWAEELGG